MSSRHAGPRCSRRQRCCSPGVPAPRTLALLSCEHDNESSSIPWVDRPAPPWHPATCRTPQPTHAAPPCRAEDLRLVERGLARREPAGVHVTSRCVLARRVTWQAVRGCSSPPRADCAGCARNVLRSCVGSWDRPATCTPAKGASRADVLRRVRATPLRTIAHRPPRRWQPRATPLGRRRMRPQRGSVRRARRPPAPTTTRPSWT